MDITTLKHNRGSCKGSLTRALTFVQGVDKSTVTISTLKIKRELVEQHFRRFDELQQLVEEKCMGDDDEFTLQFKEREEAEAKYVQIISLIDDLIIELTPPAAAAASTSTSTTSTCSHSTRSSVKLPPIDLPTFSGKYEEWTSFMDLFEATIDSNSSLSDVQKLQYLKSAVKEEAAAVIRNLQITTSNYKEAWTLLKSRYNNNREIVYSQLRRLFSIAPAKQGTVSSIQQVLDSTNECVRALTVLKLPVEHWDSVLVYITVDKLDCETRKQWALQLSGTDLPKYSELSAFLERHIRGLNASAGSNKPLAGNSSNNSNSKKTAALHYGNISTTNCAMCKEKHSLYKCSKFLAYSVKERNNNVKRLNLCSNCLSSSHSTAECTSTHRCKVCNRNHHTLLHYSRQPPPSQPQPQGGNPIPPPAAEQASSSTAKTLHTSSNDTSVLLSTAVARVRDSTGAFHNCRIMLDSGSEATVISDQCVTALGLHRQWDRTLLTGIASKEVGYSKGKVQLTIYSNSSNESIEIEALIMAKVTSDIPSCEFQREWDHLQSIQLADPMYHKPGHIDILLGAEYTPLILRDGKIQGPPHTPIALNTVFGWVLAGRVKAQKINTIRIHHTQCEAETTLKKFWEIEEIPNRKQLTEEERICESHFLSTHRRDENGRFIVDLPLNGNISKLGYSRDMAIRRLKQVERRLAKNPDHRHEYAKFMEEYIQLGHMVIVPRGEVTEQLGKTNYLPHHFIVRPESSTTKFRVVFDASAETSSGTSLNDCLRVGATTQDDIFSLLLKFRLHQIVFKADIAKMFRQFRVSEEHADLQRIVWRKSPNHEIEDYRLVTVTYGTASAPFESTRCLQQLADNNKVQYPNAAAKISEDIYVDDLMSGEDSQEKAISTVNELTKIASSAGLSFRKWSSNSQEVLQTIPEELRETQLPFSFNKDANVKALGVQWNPNSDNFGFNQIEFRSASKLTKRVVLSQLAKVFDPLGFLAPITIKAKMFLQELWKSELAWDDALTDDMCRFWCEYSEHLTGIDKFQIPRWAKSENATNYQLHGFCDASERAFGAVVYLRSENVDGTYKCLMVAAKSKVAPLQQISLPRLELCGALLLAQLLTNIKSTTKLVCEVFAWCDSTIALQWIAAHPGRWQTFVANRVSLIQELIPNAKWQHVRSEDNPADIVSRGMSPSDLINCDMWWHGPAWLSSNAIPTSIPIINSQPMPEEKKKSILNAHLTIDDDILARYSSFNKLKRVIAYCFRFAQNCRSRDTRNTMMLSAEEISKATLTIMRLVQKSSFERELKSLRQQPPEPVHPRSKLSTLSPFIDNDGLIRVGGRLQKADVVPTQRHPIVLPHDSHVTKLLILHSHITLLHGGTTLVWCHIRENYWILNARNMIRFEIRKCCVCRRNRAEVMQQLMGALPVCRVNQSMSFSNVGLDYAGPFNLRLMKGRSNKLFKGYFCIFVCMATKAIHLEAVADLTTDAFLDALEKFVSRRGFPSIIYSDCGTNFVGADKALKRLIQNDEHNNTITNDLSTKGVEWRFNPPASPHHGGLWEAGVKSVKHHLRRVVGNRSLTYDEFSTILCRVEACLNSRPLCALTADPDDLDVLTPGHFIIGRPLKAIPNPDMTQVKTNRLSRWQYTQQVFQNFWQRWRVEYLSTLQQRFKWKTKRENLSVGDLVTIRDENLPPMKWRLARITELHPGADGCVRVVTVKTSSGFLKRPVTKLTPILFNEE